MSPADILIMVGIVAALVIGIAIGIPIGQQIERKRFTAEVPTIFPSKKETHL